MKKIHEAIVKEQLALLRGEEPPPNPIILCEKYKAQTQAFARENRTEEALIAAGKWCALNMAIADDRSLDLQIKDHLQIGTSAADSGDLWEAASRLHFVCTLRDMMKGKL